MAQKKPASETATATKKTVTKAATKSKANGDSTTASAVLGTEQIGLTAGSIWSYLSNRGEASVTALKKEIGGSADLVVAAIGWLAREEKLEFAVSGKTVKVSLK